MESIIKTNNLTKIYKNQISVNKLCINVNKGDIYGFIGKNGAGKTTTLKMLLGLIMPSHGSITAFNRELKKGDVDYLKNVGSIIEFPSSYEELTAYENLKLHTRYMGIDNKSVIDEALDKAGLLKDKDKKVKKFSLGMKQRLGIARAILHKPKLLILDEPTNGLDPLGIRDLRKFILKLALEECITIIISSHILSELEPIVNKIGIIDKGVLLKEAYIDEIRNECERYADIRVNDELKAQDVLINKLNLHSVITEHRYVRIDLKGSNIKTNEISRVLIDNNLDLFELVNYKENLEDYFFRIEGGLKLC